MQYIRMAARQKKRAEKNNEADTNSQPMDLEVDGFPFIKNSNSEKPVLSLLTFVRSSRNVQLVDSLLQQFDSFSGKAAPLAKEGGLAVQEADIAQSSKINEMTPIWDVLAGKVILFTGKSKSNYSRAQLMNYCESHLGRLTFHLSTNVILSQGIITLGAKCVLKFNGKVNLLVDFHGEAAKQSSKRKKAEELGIEVWNEDYFLSRIGPISSL